MDHTFLNNENQKQQTALKEFSVSSGLISLKFEKKSVNVLGEGRFSIVYKGMITEKDHSYSVAVKVPHDDDREGKELILNELNVLKEIKKSKKSKKN